MYANLFNITSSFSKINKCQYDISMYIQPNPIIVLQLHNIISSKKI